LIFVSRYWCTDAWIAHQLGDVGVFGGRCSGRTLGPRRRQSQPAGTRHFCDGVLGPKEKSWPDAAWRNGKRGCCSVHVSRFVEPQKKMRGAKTGMGVMRWRIMPIAVEHGGEQDSSLASCTLLVAEALRPLCCPWATSFPDLDADSIAFQIHQFIISKIKPGIALQHLVVS